MAAMDTPSPLIDISSLPDVSRAEIDFLDTSFFNSGQLPIPQLPTPAWVRQQGSRRGARVVKFEHLNLAVKLGPSSYLRVEEAQTMRAIWQLFRHDEVPVPEVFGWRKYENWTFIYMSLVRGPTLREAWPSLTEGDKELISGELSRIVAALRRINQGSPSRFIGSVNGGTLQDRFFKLDYEEGPFHSIKAFNDWLLAAATRQRPGPEEIITCPDLYREFIPDTGNIYFTHGDLTLGNIVISGTPGTHRIASILDWEQSGWYPEYWEYWKMIYGVEYQHEWRSAGWVDKVVEPVDPDLQMAVGEYFSWRSP